jgi:hypothetical protein
MNRCGNRAKSRALEQKFIKNASEPDQAGAFAKALTDKPKAAP